MIDLIIEILRGSKSRAAGEKTAWFREVTEGIKFKSRASSEASCEDSCSLQKAQAAAILEMRLYKLIGLEMEALQAGIWRTQ